MFGTRVRNGKGKKSGREGINPDGEGKESELKIALSECFPFFARIFPVYQRKEKGLIPFPTLFGTLNATIT